jgi:hypothetical protein
MAESENRACEYRRNLIVDEGPGRRLSVSPLLSRLLGPVDAILVQQLHWQMKQSPRYQDEALDPEGRRWVKATYRELRTGICMGCVTTDRQMRCIIQKLVFERIVINPDWNRYTWYTIDYKVFREAVIIGLAVERRAQRRGDVNVRLPDQNVRLPDVYVTSPPDQNVRLPDQNVRSFPIVETEIYLTPEERVEIENALPSGFWGFDLPEERAEAGYDDDDNRI